MQLPADVGLRRELSSTLNRVRLLQHPPSRGAWNMAVDQAILESVNQSPATMPTLRIYRWSPATLSLGYFQRFEDRQFHSPSQECDVVRRASGGGAILHDQEITYSLTVPSANRWAKQNQALYSLVHEAIIEVLDRDFSIPSKLFASSETSTANVPTGDDTAPAFLCFERRSEGDIVCKDFKVVGSAQRRHKSAILQHGSILLEQSKFAPELPGVFELMQTSFDMVSFTEKFIDAVCRRLNFAPVENELCGEELKLVEHYDSAKFSNDDWTIRRFKHR